MVRRGSRVGEQRVGGGERLRGSGERENAGEVLAMEKKSSLDKSNDEAWASSILNGGLRETNMWVPLKYYYGFIT